MVITYNVLMRKSDRGELTSCIRVVVLYIIYIAIDFSSRSFGIELKSPNT